ncbi:MAG: hypothetical protein J3K34DRAFT_461617 [Monoraphidium minutum]|nr:MAG: hypothetical protein J3K34DRAFT_461617 [Monoraphidium minutum]
MQAGQRVATPARRAGCGAWQMGAVPQPQQPRRRRAAQAARPMSTVCLAGSPRLPGGGAPTSAAATTTAPHPAPRGQQLHGPADGAAQPPLQGRPAPRGVSGRALSRPARLAASGRAACAVADAGGGVSLDAYMRLPVEQYYILDPRQIRFLESSRFQLSVPRISLLGASLEPLIDVEVSGRGDAVLLTSTRCRLRGSGPLAGLDDKFAMAFQTVITWRAGGGGGGADSAGGGGDGLAAAMAAAGDAAAAAAPDAGAGQAWRSLRSGLQQLRGGGGGGGGGGAVEVALGEMTGSASIEVFCEVVPPFHLMPRDALEGSCNAVLGGLVRSLLPVFMRQLAADYKRWAADPAYRAERAARSMPLAEAPPASTAAPASA